MPARKYTDSEEAEIVKLYITGLYNTPQIARAYGTDRFTICRTLKRRRTKIRPHGDTVRIHSVDHAAFDKMDSESAAYWLGFIYADGHCNTRNSSLDINLSIKDRDHLIKLKEFLKSSAPIRETSIHASLRISHIHLAKRLFALGIIVGRPDHTITIKQIPDHLLRHWLRGFFDGDGHAGRTRYAIGFAGPLPLMQWIRSFLAEQVDTSPDMTIRQNAVSKQAFYLGYGGRLQSLRIADWLYQDATVYLERKKLVLKGYNKFGLGKIKRKMGKRTTSEYRGVCWDASKHRWVASICHRGKSHFLGRFDNEAEAALAYNEAAKELLGRQARLNPLWAS